MKNIIKRKKKKILEKLFGELEINILKKYMKNLMRSPEEKMTKNKKRKKKMKKRGI